MTKKYIITLTMLALVVSSFGQEWAVGTPAISDCAGFLVDSGMSASDYGPNENLTSTLCPDGTGETITNLYFSFFELGTGDELTIYDGPDNTYPVIGTYSGTELQGLDITSTNIDGCLTVLFTSNGDAEVGSFGAQISCEEPCDRPIAAVTTNMEEGIVKVCVGEEIIFDGSSSTFAEGASYASHNWDFNDGTSDNSSWPTVTHSFTEPGAYNVQLYLTDDNDCTSGNLPDKLVFVATFPTMDITADDYQVCVGQEVEVDGSFSGNTWTSLPTANFGGALFIPDDQSTCFSDTIVFGGFEPGSTISTISDLEFFYINFEHSYMGDIVISFICPNGQSVAVHQQGGAGTYLGEPVDDESDTPGVGYDYYWSPDATNGTWEENSGNGSLPAGTYESAQPLENLVGCPLNGEWIVEICDMFAIDNGFIFDWSVQFADYLYPDLISFTPTYGLGCDSSFVSGQFIVDNGVLCDSVLVVPTSAGDFTYTYTLYDDFGCVFTDEITINAYPGPIAFAGDDFYFCGDAVEMEGEVTNPVNGINYVYAWSPSTGLDNPQDPTTDLNTMNQDTEFVLSIYPQQDPNCVVTDTVFASIPPYPPGEPLDSLEFCLGSIEPIIAPGESGIGYTYEWYYSIDDTEYTSLDDASSIYSVDESGYYQVSVFEPLCNFSTNTTYYVNVVPCEIIIPNVFTPNSNGTNDSFEIFGLDRYPGSTMRIYNRWGNLVYESNSYYDQWKGTDEPEGTYFFILGVKKTSGFEYYEGHLTLLRN